jgi:sporulation-control protein spo0M
LLKGRQVDAVSATSEEAGKVGLAQVQWKLAQVVAIQG